MRLHRPDRSGDDGGSRAIRELPQPLVLRDVFARCQRDGQRHALAAAHLLPASDDRIDGLAQREIGRFRSGPAVDQQGSGIAEQQVDKRRFPMDADVLPQDKSVFVILHHLDARIGVLRRDIRPVDPAEAEPPGRRPAARIVMHDRFAGMQRQRGIGVAHSRRIVRRRDIAIPREGRLDRWGRGRGRCGGRHGLRHRALRAQPPGQRQLAAFDACPPRRSSARR